LLWRLRRVQDVARKVLDMGHKSTCVRYVLAASDRHPPRLNFSHRFELTQQGGAVAINRDGRVGPNFNRRSLLSGGILAGTVALGGGRAEARSISREVPWTAGDANKPTAVTGRDYEFLSQAEAVFLEAAVSRLIPADDLGPGA